MKIETHVQYQIPAAAHTEMYIWHKYWGKKPWNVVAKYIETYSPKNGIFLDPFCGSGVTITEALKLGRKAIAIDLNPIAIEIVWANIVYIPENKIIETFEKIKFNVKDKIEEFYSTTCHECNEKIVAWAYKRKRDAKGLTQLVDVRYKCEHCKYEARKNDKPRKIEQESIDKAKKYLAKKTTWFPDEPLYYDGKPFQKKEQYENVKDLFTDRNLAALSLLMTEIENISDKNLKRLFKITFSSMSHLCTQMMPISEGGNFTPFSSSWNQHSYWYSKEFLEQNVWRRFEDAVIGHQGILRAKQESNKFFKDIKISSNFQDVFNGKADVALINKSSLDVLEKINKQGYKIDYCFTDPPYNGTIQYGELSFMWASWLKLNNNYKNNVVDSEIIENQHQKKNFDTYHTMLRKSLKGIFDVLTSDSYCHITFTNPKTKYRNMTLNSAMFAGFEFEEIHHQLGNRPSAKSLLQPYGSVNGDFYLRFKKTKDFDIKKREQISEDRFKKIIINTAIRVILNRGEPTPYTSIVEEIDKALYNEGYFIEEANCNFDAQKILKSAVGKELVLVDVEKEKVKGKLWWISENISIKNIKIPLNERVEQVVLQELKKNYQLTFTDVWEKVATSFPNSLTPDASDIKEFLNEYAMKSGTDSWRIKPEVRDSTTMHSELIYKIIILGKKLGYSTHVGTREQRDTVKINGSTIKLSDVSDKAIKITNIEQSLIDAINNIDVYWYKNNKINFVFEVENSTSITSALERVSAIPYSSEVRKIIILPDERKNQLDRKMRFVHFKKTFDEGDWKVIFYNNFYVNFESLLKQKSELSDLFGKTRATREVTLIDLVEEKNKKKAKNKIKEVKDKITKEAVRRKNNNKTKSA